MFHVTALYEWALRIRRLEFVSHLKTRSSTKDENDKILVYAIEMAKDLQVEVTNDLERIKTSPPNTFEHNFYLELERIKTAREPLPPIPFACFYRDYILHSKMWLYNVKRREIATMLDQLEQTGAYRFMTDPVDRCLWKYRVVIRKCHSPVNLPEPIPPKVDKMSGQSRIPLSRCIEYAMAQKEYVQGLRRLIVDKVVVQAPVTLDHVAQIIANVTLHEDRPFPRITEAQYNRLFPANRPTALEFVEDTKASIKRSQISKQPYLLQPLPPHNEFRLVPPPPASPDRTLGSSLRFPLPPSPGGRGQ